jgi:hypothetical protein
MMRDVKQMSKIRLTVLFSTMLSLASHAYSQTKHTFIMTSSKVYLAEFPDQQISLGSDIDLPKLGREFLQANVVRQYEYAEAELLYYRIEKDGASVIVADDENGRVTAISTNSPGVIYSYGGVVGGPLRDAVGENAFCNTYREDSADYCYKNDNKKVVFDVEFDDNCRLPDRQEGNMSIPSCAVLGGIAIFTD